MIHSTRKRAAAYYRRSTEQQDASIDRQRLAVLPYVERRGYELVAQEEDDGLRGHVFDGRAGFQRVLAMAKAKKVDVIVVDEMTRLSRAEVVEFIVTVVHPLRQAGVTVDSVAEGPMGWDDVVGLVMLVIRQDKSSGESKTLARRTMAGLLKKANEGRYVPGHAPYGYRFDGHGADKKLVLGPEAELKVVRCIFDWCANRGWSTRQIAEELTRRAVKPPRAARPNSPGGTPDAWSNRCIDHILKNVRYVGDCSWNVKSLSRYAEVRGGQVVASDKKAKSHRNGAADITLVADTHPAIIDRDLFSRARGALDRRKDDTGPKVGDGKYLFTHLLVCGDCGVFMTGGRRSEGRGQGRYYRCSTYMRKSKAACSCNTVDEEVIRKAVVDKLEKDLLSPEAIAVMRQELLQAAEMMRQEIDEDGLLDRIAELSKWIDQGNVNLALLPPDRHAGVIAKLREWEEERERIRGQIEELKGAVERIEEELRLAESYLFELRDALLTSDPERLRVVLHEMIEKVELVFTDKKLKRPGPRQGNGAKRLQRVWSHGVVTLRGFSGSSHLGKPRC